MKTPKKALTLFALLCLAGSSGADEVKVAVAANFTAPMKEIAARFNESGGHKAVLSFGSSGKLVSQIQNGAPFGVFLSADQKNAAYLVDKDLASDQFTYAIGKLVLWSADPKLIQDGGKVLTDNRFNKLAIANPKTAPYGAAAVRVMKTLMVEDMLKPKLVEGENVSQTYQFVATKNAELGFLALSQVVNDRTGSGWIVPQSLYDPIRQDAVLLKPGAENKAASALIDFIKGPEAQAIIQEYGYDLPSGAPTN